MMDHLLTSCVHNRETWFCVLKFFGLQWLMPQVKALFAKWWIQARKRVAKTQWKGFDSLVWLVAWLLWKERNRQVHERTALQLVALVSVVLEEARTWGWAGFLGLRSLILLRIP
ncbi:hypothetical protein SETIT_8G125100v2 [Setaria italica]|uniref:Reverse transcriptase zinc-binding domain-containing protein n=2 Tax=Setaria TaxID=4554 RepID=A0A368S742_SETIT|nr:hypothetical protein SETIT_8G125100v2 [Setaria italica]TKW00752.1 hypothetical protein SEVIR_8G131900v2 [Setaria viridis]